MHKKEIGFDNEKYLKEQTSYILERVKKFGNKLYLEFGGKLMYDYHAARVLPGFDPNVKITLLQQLKDKADIIICIYAGDIERKKIRGDFGITYDSDVLKSIDDLKERGLNVRAIVITRFEEQPAVVMFKNKLERRGVKVYLHSTINGYPSDIDHVVSEKGYGSNEYIETKNPLVIITAPGPGSGKLATCLSQLYHDHKKGIKSGYAKFETFPIWNLPFKHPVNVAYEAATADLGDFNMIDHYYLESTGKSAVNYNRDMDAFPLLKKILEKISGESIYNSPTDMGVNRAGFGIFKDENVRNAAKQELIRRYFRYSCEYAQGREKKETVHRAKAIMKDLNVKIEHRRVIEPARQAALDAGKKGKGNKGIFCGAAIELKDGSIIQGKNSPLMHAASSLILNAIKHLAGISDEIHLLPPLVIDSIRNLKKEFNKKNISLNLEETLIALSMSATLDPAAKSAMEKLKELRGCEMHITHMPTSGDESGLRRLGINLTSDPNFSSENLFLE